MKKMIIGLLLVVIASGVWAENEAFPYACQSLPVTTATVLLAQSAPSVILIHNVSEADLWVTHPISGSDPGANAGWSSRLQSKRWSALALDDKAFELSCIESKPGHEQQVPCSEVVILCQWQKMAGTNGSTGSFWVAENMPLSDLLGHVEQRGFKLPEPTKR
jgi:hypothetical protein